MASIYRRGSTLWARVKDDSGDWLSVRAHVFVVGQEPLAQAWADKLEDGFAKERSLREAGLASQLLGRVRDYAKPWIQSRKERGVASWDDDDGRLRLHVLPRIGDMLISDVKPHHVRDIIRDLQKPTVGLAPRTIRNIYTVMHTLFEDAVCDERIAVNPCQLKRGELPAKVDKDAEWRNLATYKRAEVWALLVDERIPLVRRVQYALKALGALRHGEAAGLRWRHWQTDVLPLGQLVIATSYNTGRTKTKVTRFMPVHPALARVLRAWRARWVDVFGREPTDKDLVIPYGEPGKVMIAERAGQLFVEDLATLGLRVTAGEERNRGGHDLRAWFLSEATKSGARREILRRATHPGKGSDVVDAYTRLDYPDLCAEVLKIRFVLDEKDGGLATRLATRGLTAMDDYENVGRLTGIEPATPRTTTWCSTD